MGLLSDFFISDADSMHSYSECDSFPNEDSVQCKHITPLEAAGLHAALIGSGNALQMMSGFKLQTPEDANEWIMIVPLSMRTALLGIDEQSISSAASRCVCSIEKLDYSQEEYESLINGLRSLAKRAEAKGLEMYLWNCL